MVGGTVTAAADVGLRLQKNMENGVGLVVGGGCRWKGEWEGRGRER